MICLFLRIIRDPNMFALILRYLSRWAGGNRSGGILNEFGTPHHK